MTTRKQIQSWCRPSYPTVNWEDGGMIHATLDEGYWLILLQDEVTQLGIEEWL